MESSTMYVGLSAEIRPVSATKDIRPASIPAAMIGSKSGVMDSDTRSSAALNGFSFIFCPSLGASPLSPSMEINSSCTSATWVPMMTWYATSLLTTSITPSNCLIASVFALLLSFRVNRSLVIQWTTALMLFFPPTRSMICWLNASYFMFYSPLLLFLFVTR